jgi:hypothetical protein|tara:strand:+ start:610 stop:801 length:192 start_codon:yes stop_codon:yes gene_type:complete
LIEETNLDTVLKDVDNIIIITEKEGVVRLTFNQELDEMEVLDILALVTSEFYTIADEGNVTKH